MHSEQDEDNVVYGDDDQDDEDDYSENEFDEDTYDGTSGMEQTPRDPAVFEVGSRIVSPPPADLQSQPSTALASPVLEDSFVNCSLDESSAMAKSVAEDSDAASGNSVNNDSVLHDSSLLNVGEEEDDEEDSYAVDEWEEEEEEDAVVARLANLLDGTDLRRQIRDELRRGLGG